MTIIVRVIKKPLYFHFITNFSDTVSIKRDRNMTYFTALRKARERLRG